jgi:hypothetical protein
MYLQNHVIKHIPVDYDVIMPQSFWHDYRFMFEQVEKNNSEFCKLCDWDSQYVRRYGFNYLNSIYCDNINKDNYKEIKKILKLLNNVRSFSRFTPPTVFSPGPGLATQAIIRAKNRRKQMERYGQCARCALCITNM